MGRSMNPESFVLESHIGPDGTHGVALVCQDCGERVSGAPGDWLGDGDPADNTLGRLTFLADDHQALYCKG